MSSFFGKIPPTLEKYLPNDKVLLPILLLTWVICGKWSHTRLNSFLQQFSSFKAFEVHIKVLVCQIEDNIASKFSRMMSMEYDNNNGVCYPILIHWKKRKNYSVIFLSYKDCISLDSSVKTSLYIALAVS